MSSIPLVLLPGMMCNARLWRHQVEAFTPLRPVRVMPIHGADTIEQLATNALAAAPPEFALAGLSMGGLVAMEMWRQASNRITRLALLDTGYKAEPPLRQQMRDRQIAEVRAGRLEAVLRDELKPNYLAEAHRDNLALLDEVLTMGLELGEQVFVEQSTALRNRADYSETLTSIDCPTLVLCGDEDGLCPVSLHQQIAALIPTAKLEVVEQCGHLSTMERPRRVTALMRDWLSNSA